MKPILLMAPLLLTGALLSACAPAATKTSGNSANSNTPITADNPLRPGDVYLLKGTDQNGKAFEGKLKLTKARTEYSAARQQYFVDADRGYLVTSSGGVIQEAWLEDKAGEVVCVPYSDSQTLPYRGTSLRGTESEIKAMINKYSATDNDYYGGSSCVISKG